MPVWPICNNSDTVNISFEKFHALGNDFLVIEASRLKLSRRRMAAFSRHACERRSGVGADGIVLLSTSKKADRKVDIFNADGTWAEKSGNGLRIAATYLAGGSGRKSSFHLETGTSIDPVTLKRKLKAGWKVTAELAGPDFNASRVPVKTRRKFIINSTLKIAGIDLPVTCVAVGNPHTVIVVNDFDFDWKTVGADLEWARPFPNGTNVEFVKILKRTKVKVAEWERGAGATGSSGTGAAAVVCALAIQGLIDRKCKVEFPAGTLEVHWNPKTERVELTGPVVFVMKGSLSYP